MKAALLRFQDAGFDRGERTASRLLGVTLLAEGRIAEAVEYLGLSERLSTEAGDSLGALQSAHFLSVCLFLDGRLSQCLQTAEAAEESARTMCRRELQVFLRFLRARVLFQLGLYADCALRLQECLCDAEAFVDPAARDVLSAWLGRVAIFQGDPSRAARSLKALNPSREVLYFRAEAAFFSERLQEAAGYAASALAVPAREEFPLPEGVSWRDGFFSVEGRCFPFCRDDTFVKRAVRSLSALVRGATDYSAEATQDLHKLARGEDAPAAMDPNSYLHAYFYSRVLPEFASEEGDDKLTILSKSLKALQERASRIESPVQKTAFLTQNYWNRRIMDDARGRKLL